MAIGPDGADGLAVDGDGQPAVAVGAGQRHAQGRLAVRGLAMLNLMVQVVARPRPIVRQGRSYRSAGIGERLGFHPAEALVGGSFAAGFIQASDSACGTCSKNQSLW